MKKAIFLDRDGTINIDYGYVSHPRDFHILQGSGTALKELQNMGYLLIIITNQSGIGRKYYSLEDYRNVTGVMTKKLKKSGVTITDIFFCPHNPDAKCTCRKPSPEMVFRAAKKWKIDLKRSFFIGDKITDILSGKNAGCRTMLIKNSHDRTESPGSIIEQPDYTIKNLRECLPIIRRIQTIQKKSQITAIIPARLKSSRLEHKLLQDINGSPLIKYTYKNAKSMGIFRDIIIATDSLKLKKISESFGAHVMMTGKKHLSGTARINEIIRKIKTPAICNIQGDEPLISLSHLDQIMEYLVSSKKALTATAMTRIRHKEEALLPSVVKVVQDKAGYALYFSRWPIPFEREKKRDPVKFKHLGIYGYRKEFFPHFRTFTPSDLEQSEKLEQLTFLAHGIKIRLFETENDTLGIDTASDLKTFKKLVRQYSRYFHNLLN